MKYSRNLSPQDASALRVLAVTLLIASALGLLIGFAVAASSGYLSLFSSPASPTASDAFPVPEAQANIPTLTPLAGGPTATPTPRTALGLIEVRPTSTQTLAPTVTPPPTGWYVAPANPTPIPTPVLPPAAPFPESCDGPGRINVLFIGVDGRSANYDRSARSDALLVLGVNFGDRTAQLLSIPRDLWVQMPEYGGKETSEGRINTAFGLGRQYGYPGGGPGYQMATVAHNFGLRLDRYVTANFNAFEEAVDAIGGIDVYLNSAIHDEKYPMGDANTMVLDIPSGWVHMDGEVALMYARTRHQDSDFGRMRRQQKVLLAVRDKLISPDVLPHLPALAQAVWGSVATDLGLADIGLLGCVGPQIPPENVSQTVIDSTMVEPFAGPGGASVLRPKMDVILPALESFNTGE